jgi:hypothetical protein
MVGFAVSALAGCAYPAEADWGPLAVQRTDLAMTARIEGSLLITDGCVFLEDGSDGRILLVWPVDTTGWDPSSQSITVTRGDALTNLVSGQRVVLGGGATFDEAEGGPSSDEWLAGMDWVAQPRPECLTPTRWEVADVEAVG